MKQNFIPQEFDLQQHLIDDLRNDSVRTNLINDEHDMLVFSHLRWDFVFQRPQHLISRFARNRRVYFIEEPHFMSEARASYKIENRENDLKVVIPILPTQMSESDVNQELKSLLDQLLADEEIEEHISWYYTPMALAFSKHLDPVTIVYDCMDELSHFKGAPKEMLDFENELLSLAHVVFTGGQTLYEAKKDKHHNIHPFPSSIDGEHFRKARLQDQAEPADQKTIPFPRLGFFGVIDERMDIELLDHLSSMRPDWQIVMIGPVVKIDPAHLPKRPNIHYLGKKDYKELPQYLAGWDVALLPFAINDATKYISPTKTPEYLAAGRPVVSTPIRDVVRPYGDEKLVQIASTPQEFAKAIQHVLDMPKKDWLTRVDQFLQNMSWDSTFGKMSQLIRHHRDSKRTRSSLAPSVDNPAQLVT